VETVAFYSYKGGVGRSLLLAYAARYLAAILGKRVVALDFDFEAPGLHYKLKFDITSDPHLLAGGGGSVPYLLATTQGFAFPPPLEEHMVYLGHEDKGGWLRLMPAGPAPRQPYWAVLKKLGDKLRLGDSSGQGFMALLDLQARIGDELKPDYLLIDARTGVTELGGLATTILADTVVCMLVANMESLQGTLAVIDALKSAPRLANQKPVRIVPVLSRTTTETHTAGFVQLARDRLHEKDLTPSELPHDDLAVLEKLGFLWPLSQAYIELFQRLFPSAIASGQSTPRKNL
jgi:MinD-like ATPase involved in chromosome partitioning or flagellar assembly